MASQPGPRPNYPISKNHVTSLENFQEALQDSLKRALSESRQPYKRVSVFLLHWENDDMGIEKVENELASVFSDIYGYHVEQWIIPTNSSQASLGYKLCDFRLVWGGEDALVIIVYSGPSSHSEHMNRPFNREFFIAGQYSESFGLIGPKVNWGGLMHVIGVDDDSAGGFLSIMNSYYSGSAIIQDGPEVFAAASSTEIANSNLTISSTTALIKKLRDLNGSPRTISQIITEMWRERERYQLEYMPVHVSRLNRESITLASIKSSPTESKEKQKAGKGKVLLAIGISEDLTQANIAEFKRWLILNIPSSVVSEEVKVEGVFQSSSSLLLITLPIEIWTMLPNKPEYKFVSLIDGSNLLLEPPSQDSGVLSQLPIRQENIRPGSGGFRK